MAEPTDHVIEVFADVWCPFAHIGLRFVREARHRYGRDDVALVVKAWPLELVNGSPLSPEKTLEHVHELREFVAPTAFAGFPTEHFPTTSLPALALVARASRTSAHLGERASFLVRDVLFEEGRDIGDPEVVADMAARLGIGVPDDADVALVRAEWEEGRRRGVVGSPHFFCGERDVFCPSLQITRKETADGLTVHADVSRLRAFLDSCLA